jgi:hypothetical protein
MQDADVTRVRIYAHTRTLRAGDLHVCLQPLAFYVRMFSHICQAVLSHCTLRVIKL